MVSKLRVRQQKRIHSHKDTYKHLHVLNKLQLAIFDDNIEFYKFYRSKLYFIHSEVVLI